MPTENPPVPAPCATVYYDGSYTLCSPEIAHCRAQTGADTSGYADASAGSTDLGPGLDHDKAMARVHVRNADGRLVSGAAAFVAIWRVLPRWRWAIRLAVLPGQAPLPKVAYRASLRLRPAIAFAVAALIRHRRLRQADTR